MEQGTIPTMNNPQRVDLQGGGTVAVRRMKQSTMSALLEAARYNNQNDPAGAMRFASLALRWGIVEAQNIPDSEGEGAVVAVSFKTKRGIVGRLANEELVDAIQQNSLEDYEELLAIITGDRAARLSEEQSGNSGGSPDGSTTSE